MSFVSKTLTLVPAYRFYNERQEGFTVVYHLEVQNSVYVVDNLEAPDMVLIVLGHDANLIYIFIIVFKINFLCFLLREFRTHNALSSLHLHL